MNIEKGEVKIDSHRDLYWVRILLSSDDRSRKTQILACSSEEYLRSALSVSSNEVINEKYLSVWVDAVIKKWSVLGLNIFDQDIHYDIYTLTEDGETKGLEFLFNLSK